MQSRASSISKIFLALIILSGIAVLANAVVQASPQSGNRVGFWSFLVVACLAARLRVKLPGLTGTMSVNLPVILVAVAEMGFLQAVAVACLSTLVQCASQKFKLEQVVFNFCNMALAVSAARMIFAEPSLSRMVTSQAVLLAFSAAVFFLVNTIPVAIIIALTEGKNALKIWGEIFQLSFPYFVLSAGIAGMALAAAERFGWEVLLLILAIMFGVFHSYKRYFGSNVEKAPLAAGAAAAS